MFHSLCPWLFFLWITHRDQNAQHLQRNFGLQKNHKKTQDECGHYINRTELIEGSTNSRFLGHNQFLGWLLGHSSHDLINHEQNSSDVMKNSSM